MVGHDDKNCKLHQKSFQKCRCWNINVVEEIRISLKIFFNKGSVSELLLSPGNMSKTKHKVVEYHETNLKIEFPPNFYLKHFII